MEPAGHGPLPFAALSLSGAFAPAAAPARSQPRPHVAAPPPAAARSGLRSHPISVTAGPATAADAPAAAQPARARKSAGGKAGFIRLATALPAALGRLVTAPLQVPAFAGPARLSDVRVFPHAVPRRAGPGGSCLPAGGGGRKPALLWFRSDLRLHDNPALEAACREGSSVLPVYIFDPRDYGKAPGGFDRTGPARAAFILDAVADLRSRLRAAGSELVVRWGRAEGVLGELARAVGAGAVYCQAEVTAEEVQVEGRVRAALDREGAELKALWGGSLYHPEDLPFKLEAMPTSYADFRDRVAALAVRPLAETEGGVKGLPAGVSVEAGELPSLQSLGLAPPPRSAAGLGVGVGAAPGCPPLRGGEGEALRHLQGFMQELKASLTKRPTSTSPASGGASAMASAAPGASSAFSCRISPWLALGCLSPRRMYHDMRAALGAPGGAAGAGAPGGAAGAGAPGGAAGAGAPGGAAGAGAPGGAAGGADWLLFELLWRDFFRFVSQKYARLPAGAAASRQAAAAGFAPAAASRAAAAAPAAPGLMLAAA
ncbi:hypothetical protein HYH03_012836 [Edaphochlamys debaryana]|uniref:Photolyase/cryptochrome alpha/beta domain-containing protein n=1 Tax=Edaphochlamys debaryana TaxID=47281 RepID=A0A835XXI1_9CHLO|nr:hypothetical protein HYH03_012836 [Edaphochlamys debaryana]|eukprot:KAG2488675.1 hypothetical protein HYH03_012836 [Edaphochlamys debaryana]